MVCETWQPYTHRETLQITYDLEHTVQSGFSESRKVYLHIVVISSYLASILLLEQFIWYIMREHGDVTNHLGEILRTIDETLHKKGDKSSRQGALFRLHLIVEGMDDEEDKDLASCSEGVYWSKAYEAIHTEWAMIILIGKEEH